MPTSVRLDPETNANLGRLAAATGRTKSDILREAVARFVDEGQSTVTPTIYDLMSDLIGVERGGDPTLSQRTSEAVHEKIRSRKRP